MHWRVDREPASPRPRPAPAHRDRGRSRSRPPTGVARGHRLRHGLGGGGGSEPRRARAPRRHRGCGTGGDRAATEGRARSCAVRGQGQGRGAPAARRGARRRRRDLRRRAHAGAAAQPRAALRARRRRPCRADPRHLRPARRQPGGHGAGGARPAPLSPAPTARTRPDALAAGRWHRDPRPWRDPARGRPAADPATAHQAGARPRRSRTDPRHATQGPAPPRALERRARRLHERGQVHAPQPAHRRERARRGPPVLDARSGHAPAAAAGGRDRAALGHGRLRPTPAPPARGVVPLDPRGGRARRLRVAPGGRERPRRRGADRRGPRRARRDRRGRAPRAAGVHQGRRGRRLGSGGPPAGVPRRGRRVGPHRRGRSGAARPAG